MKISTILYYAAYNERSGKSRSVNSSSGHSYVIRSETLFSLDLREYGRIVSFGADKNMDMVVLTVLTDCIL